MELIWSNQRKHHIIAKHTAKAYKTQCKEKEEERRERNKTSQINKMTQQLWIVLRQAEKDTYCVLLPHNTDESSSFFQCVSVQHVFCFVCF